MSRWLGRSEPLKSRNAKNKSTADATGCVQCFRIDVELLPAIRRAGYLARARPAVSVRLRRSIGWGGHPHPPLHRARVQKPSFVLCASRCVRSLRLLSLISLLSCSGSHLAAAPFGFVPRLLEPPSVMQLPPPAICISLQIFWYIVANPLARAGLGPAFPSEIPCPPDGIHFMHAPVWVRRMGFASLRAAARRLYIAFHSRFFASLHSKCLKVLCRLPPFLFFPFVLFFLFSQVQRDTE